MSDAVVLYELRGPSAIVTLTRPGGAIRVSGVEPRARGSNGIASFAAPRRRAHRALSAPERRVGGLSRGAPRGTHQRRRARDGIAGQSTVLGSILGRGRA